MNTEEATREKKGELCVVFRGSAVDDASINVRILRADNLSGCGAHFNREV